MEVKKKISTFDKCDENQIRKILNSYATDYVPEPIEKKLVYVASPWFDDKAKMLIDFVKDQSKYCPSYKFYFPMEHQFETPLETFDADCKEIDNADLVLALISRKDVGTAFELGYAKAKNKDVILLCFDETDFVSGTNIMLAHCSKNCITIKDFVSAFNNNYYVNINVANTWKGKE